MCEVNVLATATVNADAAASFKWEMEKAKVAQVTLDLIRIRRDLTASASASTTCQEESEEEEEEEEEDLESRACNVRSGLSRLGQGVNSAKDRQRDLERKAERVAARMAKVTPALHWSVKRMEIAHHQFMTVSPVRTLTNVVGLVHMYLYLYWCS